MPAWERTALNDDYYVLAPALPLPSVSLEMHRVSESDPSRSADVSRPTMREGEESVPESLEEVLVSQENPNAPPPPRVQLEPARSWVPRKDLPPPPPPSSLPSAQRRSADASLPTIGEKTASPCTPRSKSQSPLADFDREASPDDDETLSPPEDEEEKAELEAAAASIEPPVEPPEGPVMRGVVELTNRAYTLCSDALRGDVFGSSAVLMEDLGMHVGWGAAPFDYLGSFQSFLQKRSNLFVLVTTAKGVVVRDARDNKDELAAILQKVSVEVRVRTRRVVFCGIGGASGVGKSTLASTLVAHWDSPLVEIHASSFFVRQRNAPQYPDNKKSCLGERTNWTAPEALDPQSFIDGMLAIYKLFSTCTYVPESYWLPGGNIVSKDAKGKELPFDPDKPCVLFITGPGLLIHEVVAQRLDMCVWIQGNQDICCERRYQRNHRAKRDKTEFKQRYGETDWPAYKEHEARQLANLTLVPWYTEIDGKQSAEAVARAAVTFTDDVVGVMVAADVEAVAKEAAKAAGKGVASASGSDASGSADASRPTISEVAATQEVIQAFKCSGVIKLDWKMGYGNSSGALCGVK